MEHHVPATRRFLIPTFDQQLDRLVTLGYPALAGLTEPALRSHLEPLRPVASSIGGDAGPSRVPFVVVITRDLVAPEDAVPLLRLAGGDRPGVVDRNHGSDGLRAFGPVEASTPPASAYLLVDVERGEEFCDVRPEDATASVLSRGRSPLTIEEGIALVAQVPAVLEKNRCFMLAGSRRTGIPGDRRVPALWISERAPKLGWCWDGNPHSWLGLASAGRRLGPPA